MIEEILYSLYYCKKEFAGHFHHLSKVCKSWCIYMSHEIGDIICICADVDLGSVNSTGDIMSISYQTLDEEIYAIILSPVISGKSANYWDPLRKILYDSQIFWIYEDEIVTI